MSGKEFLDSNILVYCVDEDDKTKQQTARELIASLIIAAAKAEGCEIVYSEDLNDGQEMDGVKIVNPFRQE